MLSAETGKLRTQDLELRTRAKGRKGAKVRTGMIYSAAFLRSVAALKELEGGWGDHPGDPGGETKFGISKLAYPDEDIFNLTWERAQFLYKRDYWDCMSLDALRDERLASELFEASVILDGPGVAMRRATKIVQASLILLGIDITYDGIMGPQTIGAINAYPYKDALIKLMNGLELQTFLFGLGFEKEAIKLVKERLGQVRTFLRGWLRRIQL